MTTLGSPRAIVPPTGIRPALNETGTDIGANLCVLYTPGTAPSSVALPSAGGAISGVTMAVVKAGYIGDMQVDGVALIMASATVARGALVKADAAGKVLTATTGTVVVGRCISGGDNGDLIEVELHQDISLAP